MKLRAHARLEMQRRERNLRGWLEEKGFPLVRDSSKWDWEASDREGERNKTHKEDRVRVSHRSWALCWFPLAV